MAPCRRNCNRHAHQTVVARHRRVRESSGHAAVQGLTTSTPALRKCRTLRVAAAMPSERAIAAIRQSIAPECGRRQSSHTRPRRRCRMSARDPRTPPPEWPRRPEPTCPCACLPAGSPPRSTTPLRRRAQKLQHHVVVSANDFRSPPSECLVVPGQAFADRQNACPTALQGGPVRLDRSGEAGKRLAVGELQAHLVEGSLDFPSTPAGVRESPKRRADTRRLPSCRFKVS